MLLQKNIIATFSNVPFLSYESLMDSALGEVKTLLYHELKEQIDPNTKPLLTYDRNYLMQRFIPMTGNEYITPDTPRLYCSPQKSTIIGCSILGTPTF